MTSTYRLKIEKHPDGTWSCVLYKKGRTPLELIAQDVRTLLLRLAEVVAYRDESPVINRLEEVEIATGSRTLYAHGEEE